MKRPNNRVPLLGVIFGWVLFGLVALLIVLNQFAFWRGMGIGELARASDTKDGVFFSAVTASLTVVGGIGAVAYLVIKYRERMDAERDLQFKEVREAETRLKDAVEQLGSESPQVRLAGVYALADVADTYLGEYKQRVVDILCGYLRVKCSNQAVDSVSAYSAVESAIFKVIGVHLQKDRDDLEEKVQRLDDEKLWCSCNFDFYSLTFGESVDWRYTSWDHTADFSEISVLAGIGLEGACFSREVSFTGSKFAGESRFDNAIFREKVGFGKAEFKADVSFGNVHFFSDVDFMESKFNGKADFKQTTVHGDGMFEHAIFRGGADFSHVVFGKNSRFNFANFSKEAEFKTTKFNGEVRFENARFGEQADFSSGIFESAVRFDKTEFAKIANFRAVTFRNEANFGEVCFGSDAIFSQTKFDARAFFEKAIFERVASFVGAVFLDIAQFTNVNFGDRTDFEGAFFLKNTWFDASEFLADTSFKEVIASASVIFDGSSFAKKVSFNHSSFISKLKLDETELDPLSLSEGLLLLETNWQSIDENWNAEDLTKEWTLEKKTERLKEVYKRFYTALHDHPQKAEKLAGIQKTINKNFPGVTLDFKALETEAEKEL